MCTFLPIDYYLQVRDAAVMVEGTPIVPPGELNPDTPSYLVAVSSKPKRAPKTNTAVNNNNGGQMKSQNGAGNGIHDLGGTKLNDKDRVEFDEDSMIGLELGTSSFLGGSPVMYSTPSSNSFLQFTSPLLTPAFSNLKGIV